MSTMKPVMLGEPIGAYESKMKVALYAGPDVGKTTFGIRMAQMAMMEDPNLRLTIFNAEPMENLMRVLDGYPRVKERTDRVPTRAQMDEIRKQGQMLDDRGYKGGQEIALVEFLHAELMKLANMPASFLSTRMIMVDTASEIIEHMIMKAYDEVQGLVHGVLIDKRRTRFHYGPPKRKFNLMVKRLFNLPTHVIILGRTEPQGRWDEDKKSFEWIPGMENPEWDRNPDNPSSVGYEATTVIHMKKFLQDATDENNSVIYVDDRLPRKTYKEVVRYAEVLKHKTKALTIPVFFNPAPWEIFKWIQDNSLSFAAKEK